MKNYLKVSSFAPALLFIFQPFLSPTAKNAIFSIFLSLILYDIFQGWNAPASINCFILNRQNIDKFFCLFHDTYLGCSSTKVYKAPSKGRGGGQVVSILAIYSDNLSSNPTEVYSFYSESCSKTTKINKKGPGMAHFLQHHSIGRYHCLIVISLKSETF